MIPRQVDENTTKTRFRQSDRQTQPSLTRDRNAVRVLKLDANFRVGENVVIKLVVVGAAVVDPRGIGPVVREQAD